MESIAADPMQLGTYTEEQGGDFPFFALQIGRHNEIMAISGGHFDLSDETVLEDLLLRTLNTEQSEGELPEGYEVADEDHSLLRELHDRIALLEEPDRSIVRLQLEGYSYKEIGDQLGITEKNVSVRLVRIKEKLRKSMEI